jgi:hypothetical protein
MPDPNVCDLLLARVDELTAAMTTHLAEVREVTELLEPERARACRNAITNGVGDGRRDPAAGPRATARRARIVSQVPPAEAARPGGTRR